VTLTVIVAVAAILTDLTALRPYGSVLENVKSAREADQKNVTNSELGKDSGGMMLINNCKITCLRMVSRRQRRRPTVLAGGMSRNAGHTWQQLVTSGNSWSQPRMTKSDASLDISLARLGPDNEWKNSLTNKE